MPKKDATGFNTPFERLTRLPKAPAPAPAPAPGGKPNPGATAPRRPQAAAPPAALPPAAARPGSQPPRRSEAEDQRFFEQAMRGATPLADAERGKRASPLGGAPAAPRRRAPAPAAGTARNDDADAEAELADLISDGVGAAAGGRAPDVDRRLLRRLRQGDYPIEAELDLHGRTREEAEQRLERFIAQAQDQGRRCVRVIHGRGLNSGDEGPVVRDAVQRALGGGRVGRAVLAFSFASPAQGGDGATLVLLRKKKASG